MWVSNCLFGVVYFDLGGGGGGGGGVFDNHFVFSVPMAYTYQFLLGGYCRLRVF